MHVAVTIISTLHTFTPASDAHPCSYVSKCHRIISIYLPLIPVHQQHLVSRPSDVCLYVTFRIAVLVVYKLLAVVIHQHTNQACFLVIKMETVL